MATLRELEKALAQLKKDIATKKGISRSVSLSASGSPSVSPSASFSPSAEWHESKSWSDSPSVSESPSYSPSPSFEDTDNDCEDGYVCANGVCISPEKLQQVLRNPMRQSVSPSASSSAKLSPSASFGPSSKVPNSRSKNKDKPHPSAEPLEWDGDEWTSTPQEPLWREEDLVKPISDMYYTESKPSLLKRLFR